MIFKGECECLMWVRVSENRWHEWESENAGERRRKNEKRRRRSSGRSAENVTKESES